MEWRARVLYWLLVPAIVIAAGVLGYYSVEAARQVAEASEQSVVQSTLLLVDEKVDRLEQMVIGADEAVFHLVDVRRPETVETDWPALAQRLSPSVRALFVLDDTGSHVAYACRCNEREAEDFEKLFDERVVPDLLLHQAPLGQLRHLHRTYAQQSHLFSYRAVRDDGRRFYIVLHHDTGYFQRSVFPILFATDASKPQFNIVDDDNHLVFGRSLARAGDYLVGRNFPSTLYGWRLQVAPKAAPDLRARGERRAVSEAALIGVALVILLIGLCFVVYASIQESRLNALRSEFVANVSHELKTPLSAVRMFAELLLEGKVRDESKRKLYLETIMRESERLSALIENVLDFSAIERGKSVYEMRDGDLRETVQRAVETFRARCDPSFEIRLVQPAELARSRFDEQALVLVVMNLLDNALKYGAPPLVVTITEGRRHIYVRVRDHGRGIPSAQHRRVFDRFFRLPATETPVRGSGIGLALVKSIVEAHGGRAWVEEPDGPGAQVAFSLRRGVARAGDDDERRTARAAGPDERPSLMPSPAEAAEEATTPTDPTNAAPDATVHAAAPTAEGLDTPTGGADVDAAGGGR